MDITEADKMQVARVMVNHANIIVIHSGNVINWGNLKRGVSQNSSEELLATLKCAIIAWTTSIGNELAGIQEPLNKLNISNKEFKHRFNEQPREKLQISAKIFLSHWRPSLIREAVSEVCTSLGVSKLDTVITSFPVTILGGIEENDDTIHHSVDVHRVKPVWKEMEELVEKGIVRLIGVTDFDKTSLEELHQFATVKPSIDQICMANCCDVPSDLLEFSRQHDIELLSHNDAPEILSEKSLQKLMHSTIPDAKPHELSLSYAVRYSVVMKCRGIVEAKGFMVRAERKSTGNGDAEYGFF